MSENIMMWKIAHRAALTLSLLWIEILYTHFLNDS